MSVACGKQAYISIIALERGIIMSRCEDKHKTILDVSWAFVGIQWAGIESYCEDIYSYFLIGMRLP